MLPIGTIASLIGHVNGVMHHNDKAKLGHTLEARVLSSGPQEKDVAVYYAMFLIRTNINMCVPMLSSHQLYLKQISCQKEKILYVIHMGSGLQ